MTNKTTFTDLHIIQNFTPSNLNRDDNNYPKMTDFGGVRRARISSQCIKRSIRTSEAFQEEIALLGKEISTRTRWLTRLLSKQLEETGKLPEDTALVSLAFAKAYTKMSDKKKEATAAILSLSPREKKRFTDDILTNWDALYQEIHAPAVEESQPQEQQKTGKNKKKASQAKSIMDELVTTILNDKFISQRADAPDNAFFGRMLAEHPYTNITAACQMGQAISTHAVETEYDYFTAVDDFQQEIDDESGAAMINVTGFNSACYYRYSCVDWNQLKTNLEEDVQISQGSMNAFLRASIEATPTGMKSRFAQNTQPDFALALVRQGGPGWSLANAFEKPVRTGTNRGLITPSVEALDRYLGCYFRAYGKDSIKAVSFFAINPEVNNAAENLIKQYAPAESWQDWRDIIINALD